MKLTRKQQNATRRFLNELLIQSNRALGISDYYDAFSDEIRENEPWKSLLNNKFDLYSITNYILEALKGRIPEDFEGGLAELENGKLVGDAITNLTTYLEFLPRSYFICFEMPRFPRTGEPKIELGNGLSIIDTSAGFEPELVQPVHQGLLTQTISELDKKLKRDTVYVRFLMGGFASFSLDAYSCANGISKLKHFLFVGLSYGELEEHQLLVRALMGMPSIRVYESNSAFIYNLDDKNEAYTFHLPDELSEYLKWVEVKKEKINILDCSNGKTVLDGVNRSPETPKEFEEALRNALFSTIKFQGVTDNVDTGRIKAAMEWFIDAETIKNETISYLQRCIGLETLLGDSETKDRVTDKLSDRYAFLMGRTSSERTKFKKDFSDLYGHRSSIVHGRAAKLKLDYVEKYMPKHMLAKCITKEMEGLYQYLKVRGK